MIKKDLNILYATKMLKKLDLNVYFNQKWVHIEKTDKTKYMSLFIKDDELLEKHNEIWEKVKNIIKKEFDTELVYNEKYLKTKIKSYNGKINTNFYNNKIPKEGSEFICWSLILINSIFKPCKNYYQVFLEECKYFINEKKIPTYTIDNISSDSDRENSNEEKYDKDNSEEENSNEKKFW